MLSWAVNRIKSANASGRPIPEADITNGYSSAAIEIFCTDGDEEISWKLTQNREGHHSQNSDNHFNDLDGFTKRIQEEITSKNEQVNLPLSVYYPVSRAVLDIPLEISKNYSFDLLSAYDESLTGIANFKVFFEWFREREDLENERLVRRALALIRLVGLENLTDDEKIKEIEFNFDKQIEVVRVALKKLFPGFSNFKIRRDPLRMEVEKNGKTVTINQLSDGEKCLIALVGDLARRMAIANSTIENPLEGHGIVLIDEIDLHLHPKWQRTVVSKLTEVFPNCQFLISTHSPQVINQVQPENLFILS